VTPLTDIVRLRLERRYLQLRASLKSRSLVTKLDQTNKIKDGDLLLAFCARDEFVRLPYFLDYYRSLGVRHFLVVDNGSSDNSLEYLKNQPDCSVWWTDGSYRDARFGMDWINSVLRRYADGHWVLVVDPDEFFVYPHQDTRPMASLLDWLDASSIRSFGAMLIDMYGKSAPKEAKYKQGADPLDVAPFYDPQNYQSRVEKFYFNLWIQGGPRQRAFFAQNPGHAPALNKIPLVKWSNKMVFRSSTHQLLPRSLNVTYQHRLPPRVCGALLHFKFLDLLTQKTQEELKRQQHFKGGREYRAYTRNLEKSLWTEQSVRFSDWRQLENLGLISRGDWV